MEEPSTFETRRISAAFSGLDGPTIENANFGPLGPEPDRKQGSHGLMHLRDFHCPWRLPGAQSPRSAHTRQRDPTRAISAGTLASSWAATTRVARPCSRALGFHRPQRLPSAGRQAALNLGRYQGVGFAVIEPAFGMPQDNCRRHPIAKHLSRNITGKRPRGQRVTILAPIRPGRPPSPSRSAIKLAGGQTSIFPRGGVSARPRVERPISPGRPLARSSSITGQQIRIFALIPWGSAPF